jgi:hypothetical protein
MMALRFRSHSLVSLCSSFSFIFHSPPAALAAIPRRRSFSTQPASLLAHTVDRYGAVHVDAGTLQSISSPALTTTADTSATSTEFALHLDASLLAWQAAGRKAAWIQLRIQIRHTFCHTPPPLHVPTSLVTDIINIFYFILSACCCCFSTIHRVPAARAALVPAAIARGFAFHHADPQTQVRRSFQLLAHSHEFLPCS